MKLLDFLVKQTTPKNYFQLYGAFRPPVDATRGGSIFIRNNPPRMERSSELSIQGIWKTLGLRYHESSEIEKYFENASFRVLFMTSGDGAFEAWGQAYRYFETDSLKEIISFELRIFVPDVDYFEWIVSQFKNMPIIDSSEFSIDFLKKLENGFTHTIRFSIENIKPWNINSPDLDNVRFEISSIHFDNNYSLSS